MKMTTAAEADKLLTALTPSQIQEWREAGAEGFANELETTRQMLQTRQEVRAITRTNFDIIYQGLEPGVVAFTTPANNNGIAAGALQNRTDAINAGHHENEHQKNGIFHLDLSSLTEEEVEILNSTFELETLNDTMLIEGFTEHSNFLQHGPNPKSGYLKLVKMAKEMDKLAKDKLKVSLLETFRSGNAEKFVADLKRLATHLQIEKTLGSDFSNNQSSLNNNISALAA
jgi:hypothetical protein